MPPYQPTCDMLFDPSAYDLIDLTMSYHQDMDGYSQEVARTRDADGWNASWLRFYSHAGTHMDAPLHFGVSNVTIDMLPLRTFFSSAWVASIDIQLDQQIIDLSDLGQIPEQFVAGESILLRTGWSRCIGSNRYRQKLPRVSVSLAKWCVENQVRILGVEPPSIADVNNLQEVTEIHEILLGGGVTIVEGLTNLDEISDQKVLLVALPIKISGGDGAPARVFALQKKDPK